jgi:hypothetical protein
MSEKKLTVSQRKALRRKRIAIILGDLIIVCTFITRDVLRERLREQLDGIHAAQIAYVSRFDVSTVLAQLMDFRSGVNAFIYRSEGRVTKKGASDEDNLAYAFTETYQRVATERAMLQNDETLVRSINKYWDEYWELRNASEATRKVLSEIESRTDGSSREKVQDVVKARTADEPLLGKIGALGAQAWESSKELSDTLDKQYDQINYAFWILFPIGVAVNALGALSGLEIEQGPS